MPTAGYKLVQLANGACAVHSLAYGEKMHPGLGPAAEAEALYVRQLKIRERIRDAAEEFVVWDVGLGAAANAIAVMRATRNLARPLRLVSFDDTAQPLAFALEHAGALGYFSGHEAQTRLLLEHGHVRFDDGAHEVSWQFHIADFPSWLTRVLERRSPDRQVSDDSPQRADQEIGAPPPHAILFDAFSPAKNPAMWTLPLFSNLFRLLDPARPCNLTTYSRSTMFRVTLLLAGFFVGRGIPTGMKEETTVAANKLELIDAPLDPKWLERARRSGSAEPLHEPVYRQAQLSAASWEKLQAHPQLQ